ncbi:tryptophan 7-halogenase [Catenovulum sp. SM1970]|uniref:tryptophan halogenase family protein n=1 Tax=Marinifaba aquimaris TaxID=2741323 RepID=UPI001573AE15|nr:tryptophan halogenase family protein [Marinifaba aquimaris]NTS77412.1 tryptophan 7-halogenase [Marinifaba aquimaris]
MDFSKAKGKRIVILGGGTAGWMAANLIAKSWQGLGVDISLVESSDIGIIGVGEGSTPQLKGFMDFLGLAEKDWMPKCNATFKNGIRFNNWSTKPGYESYFHPFPAQPDDYTAPAFFHNSFLRRQGVNLEGHPDHFFLATYLANKQLAPKAQYSFPFEMNYGYHFDSHLLGQVLAENAQTLGVKRIEGTVNQVNQNTSGDIANIVTAQGNTLAADIFIDCTGFRSLLLQDTLKVPFKFYKDNLFNDSAVVLPTSASAEIASQTESTALKNGWAWKIPLTNRTGNGYVYSSSFTDSDQAETELRAHLGLLDSDVQARHLKMKVGRVEQHWAKNCVAVGLSQGFIEPLEATALHIVQETIQGFIEHYQKGDFTDQYQASYNQNINRRFEAIRDYIVGHYRINSRTDSQYWLANANNNKLSHSLYDILSTWMQGKNLSDEIDRQNIGDYYPSISWHCLLAGYGIYPDAQQLQAPKDIASQHNPAHILDFIHRCSLNFQSHRKTLESFSTQ